MRVSFHGACQEVTGSCTLIETEKNKFIVDCGLFQGEFFSLNRNAENFSFDPKNVDFLLLTHAHADHCGRLPKLYKEGFRGKVYCTAATKDLVEVMLLDSAKIIFQEAIASNSIPLYLESDVAGILKNIVVLNYGQEKQITPEINIKMRDAGHILGSAIFEVRVKERSLEKKLVFSGDLGNTPTPILKNTELINGADYVFIESTYAGRYHESRDEGIQIIRQAILDVIKKKAVLMIPVFALEKVEEILYILNNLVEHKKIPVIPVYLDSPLAIKAVEIYKKHKENYNRQALEELKHDNDIFSFPGLYYAESREESKAINNSKNPKIILAGSGMCTGGRIPYHLRAYLPDRSSRLVLVAYQVGGSLGRKLLEGEKKVFINDTYVDVKAKVQVANSFSSHGDFKELLDWAKAITKPKPKQFFVVHGELESNKIMADYLEMKMKIRATIPEYGKFYEI